ncbi:hypothetical protein [Sinomicrobium sp.]
MDLQAKKTSEKPGVSASKILRLGRKTFVFGLERLHSGNIKTMTLLVRFSNPKRRGQTELEIKVLSFGIRAIRYGDRLRLGYIKRRQVLQKV